MSLAVDTRLQPGEQLLKQEEGGGGGEVLPGVAPGETSLSPGGSDRFRLKAPVRGIK